MKLRIEEDGLKIWLNNKDQYHNIVEPARGFPSGNQYWYRHGKQHRLDGPAEEYSDGHKCWRWLGKRCTEKQHYILSNIKFFTRRVPI